ncbi:phosphotransferase enzyme family protein [Mycolicibacterium hassiacum DSM 44199]|uniref:Phosphotransferase enzyme family protein n=1 Tax=Mycolicibacterium hassiacum (strain DSM 44199 / CIP 105218 / JCM 12690 / 3849) TaxID=1122247 RepID=K5BJ65_MYCHD|nr:aminotransferase [Mycolicibacterium hassiacum]EKF22574.1 phosphotransferase enzyme family protein [Mycolicibacterium hassiacum DSM 44199]MDA4088751.1 4-aminobutyrate aminotransferase [Mycolicibacterium hassiacum DSM 44199]VCT91481.1 Isoleucine 2-epimerase [Mycolicibacterium hassiacum DSM 44199]
MTTGFNFLEQEELPAPRVSAEQAERLLAEHFGLRARATPLGSQQDCNYLMTLDDGAVAGVLKIANPAFTAAEVTVQDAAAERIAAAEPDLRVAVALPNSAGRTCTAVDGLLDGTAQVRLLRYLDGGTLVESGFLAPSVVAELGSVAGRVSRALAGFDHAGLDRVLQWDPRFGFEVVTRLVSHVEPAHRDAIRSAAAEAWERISAVAGELPVQAVHLDLTDANLVVSAGGDGPRPDGVIDFGDLTRSWAVSELAVTASCVLGHPGCGPTSVLPAVRAFHAIRPLSAAEAEALWPLVVLRTAVLIVSGAQQALLDPDNDYLTAQSEAEWRMFTQAVSVPMAVMTELIRADLGRAGPRPAPEVRCSMLPAEVPVTTLDLETTCDGYDNGAWLDTDVDRRLAEAAAGDGVAVTVPGQPRLSQAPALGAASPEVVPTGVDLFSANDIQLRSPWDGEIVDVGDGFTVRGATHEVTLRGVRAPAGGAVRAGDPLAVAPARSWVHVGVRPVGAPVAPRFTTAELAPGWLALACDPRPLFGLQPPSTDSGDDLLARRAASFAPVQEFYYRRPPRIERGWRHFLISTRARSYLDMVNNVTVLGHAHPRVAETAARQLRKLNTNSRFNYEVVVEFSERLAATLPDPLDTVFLVNSGSEASDLALRLATAATGRRDVVAVREAYHGWTYGTDAVSTSIADNPNALATRPEWVHTVEAPNSFRGKYRGAEAVRYAPEAVAQIEELAAAGRPPAAFICESVYGNAGGLALPDGYLQQVYAAVRACGGLAISDEVQVGYGRLGHWFWGFEQQNAIPDIVSVAKATGNGYPLGAVITSREVAERFSSQGYFFSSTGGSPLSCAIGLTVLDVLREEKLQDNAIRVGTYLKDRLLALADRHPIVGTVHGFGLYLGVELVRDRQTLEPATAETAAICERMLDLGVIIQPTGDHQNVLKTKPPLCIDTEAADFYVDMLDRVLTEGW